MARIDGAGLAPADHHRHERRQPERGDVRAGPVRDGPGHVADHPQPGRDGAAGRGCRPLGPAPVPAQRGQGRRHGCFPAGRHRGAGAGRGRPAGCTHPLWTCDGGEPGPEAPGADAGRNSGRPGERLPDGIGRLLPRFAGAGHRRQKVSGRRLQRQHAHRPCQEDGRGRTGVRGPGGCGHHPPEPDRPAHRDGAQLLGAGRYPPL